MPRHEGPKIRMELVPLSERLAMPDRCQVHWYELIANYVSGKSVLDVGAGTGYGLSILAAGGATSVKGIDPLPAGPEVTAEDVSAIPDGSFDVAVACDVIEHIEDDAGFLAQLLRVAREAVFVATPNWDRFHCGNPYHAREYTHGELAGLLSGLRYEAWNSEDPATHVWRVPQLSGGGANFGIWIWKGEPFKHRDEPRADLWNALPSADFLAYDRPNPARAAAAAVIAALNVRRMVEVGPGAGYDYLDHFRHMPVSYTAYEGSSFLRDAFLRSAPEADVRAGGFLDLAPDSFDLCYTKATLEHQRDFRDGLRRMVAAAPHVVVNWYLPPDADGELCHAADQGVWYNRYRRVEVMDFLQALGCLIVDRPQPPPGNSIWIIGRGTP